MTKPEAAEPQPCTTYTRRRRHLSRDLTVHGSGVGRSGVTLCGLPAGDEVRANTHRRGTVVVAHLPACASCQTLAGRYGRDGAAGTEQVIQ